MTPDHINHTAQRIEKIFQRATCLYTKNEIEAALDKMAKEITAKVSEDSPIFMCVLLGGIVTLGNLLTRLNFPLELDYAHATRYTGKTRGGDIVWKAKPRSELKDRTVVIVDDILDGGITLAVIKDYCIKQGAAKVLTAVLVDKKHPREQDAVQVADFKGMEVDDKFIFGYGLDYEEYLRNVPGIYVVAPEDQ